MNENEQDQLALPSEYIAFVKRYEEKINEERDAGEISFSSAQSARLDLLKSFAEVTKDLNKTCTECVRLQTAYEAFNDSFI